jgi:hypothetical protein
LYVMFPSHDLRVRCCGPSCVVVDDAPGIRVSGRDHRGGVVASSPTTTPVSSIMGGEPKPP